jgi:pyruvate kinase
MIESGVDVFRLNFSHGTQVSQKKTYDLIRNSIGGSDTVAILVDLSGPKFRIGRVSKPFVARKDEIIILTSEEVVGNEKNKRLSVSHKNLPKEVKKGSTLYINDGLVGLTVQKVEGNDIYCKVFSDGPISSRKGINAPDIPLSLYFPTKKDLDDAKFVLENFDPEPDFFAASFIRRAGDLTELKHIIDKSFKKTKIISKIEHLDALDHIDEIIEKSDGIMVARGDLGIEIPTEDVPIWQKRLIKKCNLAGKPVITATQMLESMTTNKRPTRAEASDVSNAVIDGTDAVMLSGETASGKYPIDAIEYMDRIANRAESLIISKVTEGISFADKGVPEMLGYNAFVLSKNLDLSAIIAITRTGNTARIISKYRPHIPILACTGVIETARQLRLTWGVNPVLIPIITKTDELIFKSIKECLKKKYIQLKDSVLVVAGTLLGIPSKTNLLQILKVEDVLSLEHSFLME